jgi:hypothetical protein
LLAFGAAGAHAATFNFSMTCPADTIVGPITVKAAVPPLTGSVTLTPGVPAIDSFLPTNQLTQQNNNAAAGGTYLGTLNCTLTFGGVPTNFSRSFSLNVPPLPSPPNSATGLLTTGAVSFTVDLGAQGKVDVSSPAVQTLGFDRLLVNGGFIVVPFQGSTTLLLHDVPEAVVLPVPLPPYLVLNLMGMIALGLYLAQRGRRKKGASR